SYYMFFFFQAEDGIRDRNVTGVQTCALPISDTTRGQTLRSLYTPPELDHWVNVWINIISSRRIRIVWDFSWRRNLLLCRNIPIRSEERRVGKECRVRLRGDVWKEDGEM